MKWYLWIKEKTRRQSQEYLKIQNLKNENQDFVNTKVVKKEEL
jgi:hypothetical protein